MKRLAKSDFKGIVESSVTSLASGIGLMFTNTFTIDKGYVIKVIITKIDGKSES